MLDIRYHIVSLIAVFLALGLGMLIGTIVVQDPDLLRVQDNLIQELSDDLKALDMQNAQNRIRMSELEQSQRELEGFAEEVFPLLVSNRLFGRHVAVVGLQDPDSQEYTELVRDILVASGASVRVVVLEQPVSDLQWMLHKAGLTPEGSPDEGITVVSAARTLVDSAILGYDAAVTRALVDAECLAVYDAGEAGRADSAVVVTESVDPASAHVRAIQPLLEALAERGAPAIVVSQSAGAARMPARGATDIEVVDRLDTVPAKYRLIMALAGEARKAASD